MASAGSSMSSDGTTSGAARPSLVLNAIGERFLDWMPTCWPDELSSLKLRSVLVGGYITWPVSGFIDKVLAGVSLCELRQEGMCGHLSRRSVCARPMSSLQLTAEANQARLPRARAIGMFCATLERPVPEPKTVI